MQTIFCVQSDTKRLDELSDRNHGTRQFALLTTFTCLLSLLMMAPLRVDFNTNERHHQTMAWVGAIGFA
eukprot:scaffold1803_cov92-Amphora_coffeaeformis.AAC.54